METKFEAWFLKQFGADKKHLLKPFDKKDGYQDEHVNAMWIGFNGGCREN